MILIFPFCAQTKTSNAPLARSKSSTRPNAWGAAAVPAAVMQAKPSQDGFSNVEVASQPAGDVSVGTRVEEPVRMGPASTATAEDHPVPEASGIQSSAAPKAAAHAKVQVRLSDKMRNRADNSCLSCHIDMQQCIISET